MKPVNGIAKMMAAATALSITFALVWGIANFGYPGMDELSVPLLAAVAN
jgi:hypothetical protein